MAERRSISVTIIGVVQVLICLVIGLPLFTLGLAWAILDALSVATRSGGNLTGLGFLVGLPMCALGALHLFGLVSAVFLLKRHPRGRRFAIIFMSLATLLLIPTAGLLWFAGRAAGHEVRVWVLSGLGLFNLASLAWLTRARVREQFIATGASTMTARERVLFILSLGAMIAFASFVAVQGHLAWTRRLAGERQRQAEAEAEDRREDQRILKRLENDQVVTVRFSFDYADDHAASAAAGAANLETRKALNRAFVTQRIITPIGQPDLRLIRVEDSSLSYVAAVTASGYEQLKSSPYTRWIRLVERP